MHLNDIAVVLGQATATPVNPTAEMLRPIGLMVLMVAIFYVIMIRPNQKRAKEQAQILKTLRPGDKVLTSSGIMGTVVSVKEKTVTLRSAETKLEILKSAVTDVTERAGGEAGES